MSENTPPQSDSQIPEVRLAEDRFRDLADLSADWFWEQDAEFRFTFFSRGLEHNDFGTHQFLGWCRWDLPIELSAEEWESHKAMLRAHLPFRNLEYRIKRPDGGYNWFENSGKPIFDIAGRFVGYRGIGRNITRRKDMEEELRRHRDHLEEMVRAQTADLLKAKEAAELASRVKSEFLANISHELRTPMHAILSFARLGAMKAGTTSVENLRDYFMHIRSGGDQLLALVNELLDLSRLESGRLKYEMKPLDISCHAYQKRDEFSAMLERKHLECQIVALTPDCTVECDRRRIDQVFTNLLGNAIKFSAEGKRIWIELAADHLPGGRRQNDVGEVPALRITIADEGVGIPENELETVFEKFTQSTRTADGAGGTGLGLAISREIVLSHRGIIRARNRTEGGAAFDVLLPLPKPNSI